MILVDANLLVYAHVASFPQHARAHEWLDERINAAAPVGLPWPSLLAFARIASNPRIFPRPASVAAAWRQVESWLATESVWIPLPTERHQQTLAPMMQKAEGRAIVDGAWPSPANRRLPRVPWPRCRPRPRGCCRGCAWGRGSERQPEGQRRVFPQDEAPARSVRGRPGPHAGASQAPHHRMLDEIEIPADRPTARRAG